MSEQIVLSGFDAPHEKESEAYREILPTLQAATAEAGAKAEAIKIKHNEHYSSIWYASVMAFRLKLRKARYIEVPMEAKSVVQELGPAETQKATADGFWRVKLGPEPVREHADILAAVLREAIERLPKEWDCCSRYMECSDAKRCIHPDPSLALKCGYRKILASGRIYYGENRNVDGRA